MTKKIKFKLGRDYINPDTGEVRIKLTYKNKEGESTQPKERQLIYAPVFKSEKPNNIEIDDYKKIYFKNDEQEVLISNAVSELSYSKDKNKGQKIVNRTTIESGDSLCPNFSLLEYDFVVGVDTNTITINNTIVSVACVMQCIIKKEGGGINMDGVNLSCVEFNNIAEKQENYAWMSVITSMTEKEDYKEDYKIAMIVDSDLSNIDDYNTQTKPIYEMFYLPKNFKLIYASGERDTSRYAVNGIINFCDKEANKIINVLRNNEFKALELGRFRIYNQQAK